MFRITAAIEIVEELQTPIWIHTEELILTGAKRSHGTPKECSRRCWMVVSATGACGRCRIGVALDGRMVRWCIGAGVMSRLCGHPGWRAGALSDCGVRWCMAGGISSALLFGAGVHGHDGFTNPVCFNLLFGADGADGAAAVRRCVVYDSSGGRCGAVVSDMEAVLIQIVGMKFEPPSGKWSAFWSWDFGNGINFFV